MAGRYPDDGHVGRRHPASGVRIDLGEPTIVFVTVVTRDRKRWLAQPLVHQLLRDAWMEAQACLVGYYLLMPDHLHLFCAPHDLGFTLDEWITFWKRQFKRKLNAHLGRVRPPPNPHQTNPDPASVHPAPADGRVRVPSNPDQNTIRPAPADGRMGSTESHPPLVGNPTDYRWQEGKPWDTRLRRSESYQEKWQYIRENPVRKGLVGNADDWLYQGMLTVLPW